MLYTVTNLELKTWDVRTSKSFLFGSSFCWIDGSKNHNTYFKFFFIQFKQESYKKHTNAFINSFTVTLHSRHISHLYSTWQEPLLRQIINFCVTWLKIPWVEETNSSTIFRKSHYLLYYYFFLVFEVGKIWHICIWNSYTTIKNSQSAFAEKFDSGWNPDT